MLGGSIFFQFFGVLFRWLIINLWNIFSKKKYIKFKDIWSIPNRGKDSTNELFNESSNIIIGFIFLMAICFLVFYLNIRIK